MLALRQTSSSLHQRRTTGNNNGSFSSGRPSSNDNNEYGMLACSVAVAGMNRTLCEDRRAPFEHVKPMNLFKGIVRVTMQQGATIFSSYMSDQLKEDMARDERVQNGEMSAREADDEAQAWSDREWEKRWEVFPSKLITAYMKYHATTLIMRLYEHLASRNFTLVQLDKLTLDPFSAAKRRQKQGQSSTVMESSREAWDANLIAYLADYSLHQIILAAGYYAYIRQRKQQQQQRPTTPSNANNDEAELYAGSLALSFLKKSTLLAISRAVCLSFASLGGGIGNIFYPGWGYMFGFNMGDGFGATVIDEFDLNETPLS